MTNKFNSGSNVFKKIFHNSEVKSFSEKEDLENAKYYLEYLKANGLNKEKNKAILEVSKTKSNLNTQLINDGFNNTVITLDNSIKLDDSTNNYIYGELTTDGIVEHKKHSMIDSPFCVNTENRPNTDIYTYDTIITKDCYNKIPTIISYNTNDFLGYCESIDSPKSKNIVTYYKHLVDRLNIMYRQQFYLQQDVDIVSRRSYGLIKKYCK